MEDEWPSSGGRPGGKYGVWEKYDDSGVERTKILFGVSHPFFYDRNVIATKGKAVTMYIEPLEKVFPYLGCLGGNIAEQMNVFYQFFNVKQEVVFAQKNQRQDSGNGKKKVKSDVKNSSVITTNHQNISAENINHLYFNIQAEPHTPQTAASEILYAFYGHVATGSKSGFDSAWSLLSDSFQERIWAKRATELKEMGVDKQPVDHFRDGYYFFRSLRDTHVFNMKVSGQVANCMVYYEEELELPHIEELVDINKTAIKHVHTLVDKIKAIAKIVDECGGKGFSDKALIRLFYPTPTETIWFEHGVDREALKRAFPLTTTTVHRLMKCRCVRQDDNWRIDGLVPLHCRQL